MEIPQGRTAQGLAREKAAIELYERRKEYEPAPLRCDRCGLTMHLFAGNRCTHVDKIGRETLHDMYKCGRCGQERIWG